MAQNILIVGGVALGSVEEIPKDKDLILLCNTGVRSYEAQLNLTEMGMTEPVSVQGGIVTLNKCGLDL